MSRPATARFLGVSKNFELVKAAMLEVLDERERRIVEERFLLDETLQEIADVIGCTRERVRQLEKQAIWKLRCATWEKADRT